MPVWPLQKASADYAIAARAAFISPSSTLWVIITIGTRPSSVSFCTMASMLMWLSLQMLTLLLILLLLF